MRKSKLAAAAALIGLSGLTGLAQAQSNVTVYGSIDQYLNAMKSSSGTKFTSLEDGAFLRSRWGFRGTEELGDGFQAKFQLEAGFSADTGNPADTRAFDRQSWVGLAGKLGEIRFGRQNSPIFYKGDYIDHTSRTLGSIVNTFGVPSRYDNSIEYISPRLAGVQVDAQVALAETTGSLLAQAVYVGAIDYVNGPYRVGYAALRAKPPSGAAQGGQVKYDNAYANFDYGNGKVYLAYVRSNNNTSTAVSNNAGTLLGNIGGVVSGTNADVNHFYDIFQVSVDYRINDLLRLGALWGKIDDKSGRQRGANGGAISAYYSLSKRTTLLAQVDTLRNDSNGGWRPAGSAGLKTTFTTPADINGRTINGLQLGIVHRF